jgi:SWIM zinc finger
MVSYLKSIKLVVNQGVYNRGIRLYLDGAVSKSTSMVLDNWRKYTVIGTMSYTVKIPLIHLTLDQNKFDKAGIAIEETATCECEYYYSYGPCKHIVAVCASIDKEFDIETRIDLNTERADHSSVLDNIFEAEKVKKHRKWYEVIEMYLTREHLNYFYLDEISKTLVDEPLDHDDFLLGLYKIVESVVGEYSKEKLLIKIILETILVGKKVWWDFWLPFLLRLDERNQTRLFVGLWKIRWLSGSKTYRDELDRLMIAMKNKEKAMIFEQLKIEFENQREIWLEYCFVSKYFSWLEENIDALDPNYIVKMCLNLPEKREEYEYKILNQVKVWSDFLQVGKYDEIKEFFHLWQHTLGRSEVYEEAVKYFQTNHPKKKKLLSSIS